MRSDTTSCTLCGRPFDRKHLTKHHCLPRARGGTVEDVELLCSQCHGMVHATYTNRTLADLYPTIAELRQAPELAPFLRWVRKQPPSRRTRNEPRRRKL
jgi:5-methylcytosine-specific restriction endonuclease McrA